MIVTYLTAGGFFLLIFLNKRKFLHVEIFRHTGLIRNFNHHSHQHSIFRLVGHNIDMAFSNKMIIKSTGQFQIGSKRLLSEPWLPSTFLLFLTQTSKGQRFISKVCICVWGGVGHIIIKDQFLLCKCGCIVHRIRGRPDISEVPLIQPKIKKTKLMLKCWWLHNPEIWGLHIMRFSFFVHYCYDRQ